MESAGKAEWVGAGVAAAVQRSGTRDAYQGLRPSGPRRWVRPNEKLSRLQPQPAAMLNDFLLLFVLCGVHVICVPSVFRDINFHQLKNPQQCCCTNISCLARMLCGFLMAVKTLFILKFTPYIRNLWF